MPCPAGEPVQHRLAGTAGRIQFGLLLLAIDRTRVVPLNFAGTFQKAKEALDLDWH